MVIDFIFICGLIFSALILIATKVKISNNMIIKILMEKFNDIFKRLN